LLSCFFNARLYSTDRTGLKRSSSGIRRSRPELSATPASRRLDTGVNSGVSRARRYSSAVDAPPVRYINRDGARLAYQLAGDGEWNLVWLHELLSHLELSWTDPHVNHLFERGADYSRTVFCQRRGLGVSDPIDYVPTLEQWAGDIVAVMDEAGMSSATLIGNLCTCAPAVLVAAMHPHRVRGLFLANPMLQGPLTSRPLLGLGVADVQRISESYRQAAAHWGEADMLPLWESAIDTPFNRRLWSLLERCSASRDTARAYVGAALTVDVTELLPSLRCPVRVLRTATGIYPEALGRAIAESVPDGTYVELPAPPRGATLGESMLPWIDEVRTFVTGAPRPPDADRRIATMLFTDLVGSTEILGRIGDAAYRELRAAHEREVRLAVELSGGRLVNVTGDGTVSLFDVPSKAVRAALTIRAGAVEQGLGVRTGVHTGEVDWSANDLSGMAVHIAARVGAAAGPGEILASSTVRDLLFGSSLTFSSQGRRELKGVPGRWELFTIEETGDRRAVATPAPIPTLADRAALRTARALPSVARLGVRLGSAANRRRYGHREPPAAQ
jgi:class 3 adenylate cyclase/pimeloyl-ACP methyl ester carboxylesterase